VAIDNVTDCHEELLLPRWRTHAEHPRRFVRFVFEGMWSVGRDIHSRADARTVGLAPKGQLDLAIQNGEHFLEIVTMGRRTATGGTSMSIKL
jgi:hypothetical protein